MKQTRWNSTRRITLALAAGVLLNTAVAFLCLCYSPARRLSTGIGGNDGVGVPAHTMVRKAPEHSRAFGIRLTAVEHFWVSPPSQREPRYPQLYGVQVDSIAVGWPLTTIRTPDYDTRGATTYAGFDAMATAVFDRIDTHDLGLTRLGAQHRLVPTQLVPVGFILNSVFYGLILFAAVLGFRSLQCARRRRAGLCLGCAYPVAGHPICPECGRETAAGRRTQPSSLHAPSTGGMAVAKPSHVLCRVPTWLPRAATMPPAALPGLAPAASTPITAARGGTP